MKKLLLLGLTTLISCSMLFASGTKEADADRPVISIASNITQASQVDEMSKIYQTLVDEYNQKNGTNYELKFTANQGMDIINTRMSSKDKPDIFPVDSPADATRFANDGLLYDLTEYATKYGWKDSMFSWAYDLSQVNGKVMSVPFGYEGLVIWYNKSMMKELGIDASTLDTLPEFETALQKAQDSGYIPIMLGSQDWPWAQEWYLSILYSYTSRTLLKNTLEGTDKLGWNDPRFKKTVELYKNWHQKGYLANGKSFILTSDDAINAFTTNKALFKLEGTWAPYWITPLTPEEQANIGVMLHPSINDTEKPHLPLAIGQNWCISADSNNADIAAYILDGTMRDEFQSTYLETGCDVAPVKISAKQFENLAPVVQEMWSMVNDALANNSYGYATYAFYPPETRLYAYEGIVNVLENNISVDEYLDEMQKLNTKEIANGFTPIIPEVL
jgi:raffinose/stachyose/melibiose transport system substrate-binding protein